MGDITCRRVTRADFSLLADWLAQLHVARWWNHEFTPQAVERDFGPTVDREEPNEDHLVLVDGQPIGLIQYSRFEDYPQYIEELRPHLVVPDGAVTVDYLIGDPTLTRRGLGAAMIARFVERIWETNPGASCVIVPVSTANEASWRALRHAGFRVVARGIWNPTTRSTTRGTTSCGSTVRPQAETPRHVTWEPTGRATGQWIPTWVVSARRGGLSPRRAHDGRPSPAVPRSNGRRREGPSRGPLRTR